MRGWLAVVLHFVCFFPYRLAPPFQTASCESPQTSQRNATDLAIHSWVELEDFQKEGKKCVKHTQPSTFLFFFAKPRWIDLSRKRGSVYKQRDGFNATCRGLPLSTKTMLTGDLWRATEGHSSRGWIWVSFFKRLRFASSQPRIMSGRRLNLTDFDAE